MEHSVRLDHVVPRSTDTVVALAEFDGVHRRHVELVARARQLAGPRRASVIAVVVDRGGGVPQIMTVDRRCALLLSCGVSSAFVAPLPRADDVQDVLGPALERMRPVAVFVDRESWPSQPRDSLYEYLAGIGAVVRDEMGSRTSTPIIDSSAIIALILEGDVRKAAELLGRPYELCGEVAVGSLVWRGTGLRTERVVPAADVVLPRPGTYAARTVIGRRWVGAAVNVGRRPASDSARAVIEGHLIDFEGELQDNQLSLRLLERLHNELQFCGPDELAAQIGRDISTVTALLRSLSWH